MSAPTGTPRVRVRRCSVRVRRHGGWSWGEPDEYVSRILAAIEAALSDLAGDVRLPEGIECRIVEPVTLHVTRDGRVTTESRRALAAQVRGAVAVSASAPTGSVVESPRLIEPSDPLPSLPTADPTSGWRSLAVTLGRWSRSGRLLEILGSLPTSVVRAWADALVVASLDQSSHTRTISAEAIDAIADVVLAGSGAAAAEADDSVRVLLVAGAVIAAAGDQLPDASAMDVLLQRIASRTAAMRSEGARPSETRQQPNGARSLAASVVVPKTAAVRPAGPAIVPALPFLTLIQLARLGFTEPAAAALAAARVGAPPHVFAAAVAGKVLEPPGRGWARDERDLDAVRLASGLEQDEIDVALAEVAAASDVVTPAWRAALIDLYVEGRSSDADAYVTASEDERICGEEAGLLPIAWVEGDDELGDVLAQLGQPVVRQGDALAPLVGLFKPRRGIPGLDAPTLERQLGAIVGTAIGSLGQELWGNDADLPLTFDRLRDLEARVVVGDRVVIGLPRGQRWLDLRRAGLLEAWPIPWARGDAWELVTW